MRFVEAHHSPTAIIVPEANDDCVLEAALFGVYKTKAEFSRIFCSEILNQRNWL